MRATPETYIRQGLSSEQTKEPETIKVSEFLWDVGKLVLVASDIVTRKAIRVTAESASHAAADLVSRMTAPRDQFSTAQEHLDRHFGLQEQ